MKQNEFSTDKEYSMKKIFAILTIILFTATVNAQTHDPELEKMNGTRKLMYGDALMSAGSYYGAQDAYKLAYEDEASQEAAYKLARAYYLARNYKDAEKWYSEDMFVRFKILKSSGTIKGINPLEGKL